MTIERQDCIIVHDYVDGVTEYPFPFPALSTAYIITFDRDPELPGGHPDRDTVINNAVVMPAQGGIENGGFVRLSDGIDAGHQVVIVRTTPRTQQLTLDDQRRIPAKALEVALDRLTMISQELQSSSGGGDTDYLLERLEELAGRLMYKADQSDLAAEAAARNAADLQHDAALAALERAKADAADVDARFALVVTRAAFMDYVREAREEFAAYRLEIEQRLRAERAAVDAALAGKQPLAPAGGPWAGSGGSWSLISMEEGEPFKRDDEGYVVQVARPAVLYAATPVWDVGDFLTVKPTARPGDEDECWIIDADGFAVTKSA